VPDTISTEARQFLSTASAGLTAFGSVSFGNTPDEQKAAIAKLRGSFADLMTPIAKAAEVMYMQSTRNGTIGGVPVMYAVPKGVNPTSNADAKVLLYMHGGCVNWPMQAVSRFLSCAL
jgi:acetyl esterase/lipase